MDRRKTPRNPKSVNDTAQYLESLKMNRRSSPQSVVRAAIEKKLIKMSINEEFSTTVEKLLLKKLSNLLNQMVFLSHHRCTPLVNPDHSTAAWLLHKEDLAVHYSKNNPSIPAFTEEYTLHAGEESERNLLTAQSVRRLTLKDLLPFVDPKFVNSIARRELISEYTQP